MYNDTSTCILLVVVPEQKFAWTGLAATYEEPQKVEVTFCLEKFM